MRRYHHARYSTYLLYGVNGDTRTPVARFQAAGLLVEYVTNSILKRPRKGALKPFRKSSLLANYDDYGYDKVDGYLPTDPIVRI